MGLKKESVDNTRKLLNNYRDAVVDKEFIRDFIMIIEDSMEESINYHFIHSKKVPASLDTKDMSLYIDPVHLLSSLKKNIIFFSKLYPNIDMTKLRNFFATGTILHETSHLNQAKMAYLGASPYEEIRRLYRLLFDTMDRSKISKLKYNLNPGAFFHERNAWILSSIDLFKIYEGTELEPIATNIFISSIMDGYHYHTCPVKSTLNRIGLPYGFDLRGIPFLELLYNGFMVDVDKYNQVIDFLGDKPVEELSVLEIDEKIRSLR